MRRFSESPRGVSVIESGEVECVVPAARRFRHPGYELLRSISREEMSIGGVLDEEDGLLFVAAGLKAVAERKGCCVRTVRRQLVAAGVIGGDLVHRIRLRMTETALENRVPVSLLAKWLGFASPDAYRRFIRREFGVSVKKLRCRVRESTVFLATGR